VREKICESTSEGRDLELTDETGNARFFLLVAADFSGVGSFEYCHDSGGGDGFLAAMFGRIWQRTLDTVERIEPLC
jgi:hypothetical protein